MNPINVTPYISTGIAVFFPTIEVIGNYLIKLEVYYSQYNPLFDWVNCNNSEVKLWEQTASKDPAGLLFLYQTPQALLPGFYTVRAALLSTKQSKSGQLTVGLNQTTPYLAIGIPYSMYPPITLV